jgi:hypothetical protein
MRTQQGAARTTTYKQVQSVYFPLYRARNSEVYNSIAKARENFHMTGFSDCCATAAFEKPSKMGRLMFLSHAKCDESVHKYDPYMMKATSMMRLTMTVYLFSALTLILTT